MTIIKNGSGTALTLNLEGRLDTTTAPQLELELKQSLPGITALILGLEKLEYISSAGLRVVLTAQKQMNRQGSMVVSGACASIMEVFEMTGFSDILTFQ